MQSRDGSASQRLRALIRTVDPFSASLAFLLTIASAVSVSVIFLFTTFATIRYVDAKNEDALMHANRLSQTNRELLLEIKDSVQVIEQRTWEMSRTLKPSSE